MISPAVSPPRLAVRLLLAAAFVCSASLATAQENVSFLSKSGILFELAATETGSGLAVTTTAPSGNSVKEIVPGFESFLGTVTPGDIAFEETTGSVFLVYTTNSGVYSQVGFAIGRNGNWVKGSLAPTWGFYMSMNPRLCLTRQTYIDVTLNGSKVEKKRSILSIVWWEEAYAGKARYAPIFVEDGALLLDSFRAYTLPQLLGEPEGPEDRTYPYSAYMHPSVEADASSNGGVRVTFANIASAKTIVSKIAFPDDLTAIDMSKVPPGQDRNSHARGHTPVGRTSSRTPLQREIDTTSPVYIAVSASGTPTYYWEEGQSMQYVVGGSPQGAPPVRLQLSSKLSKERAQRLIREMASRD